MKVEGCQLKIVQQLDRKLYERTNKVLAALGGKWKGGKTQAHIFPRPVSEVLEESLDAGFAVDEKKALCQFFTPPDVAARMVEVADITSDVRILEPSAGTGNLLRAVFDVLQSGMSNTTAIEISPELIENLRVGFPAVTFRCADFLECIDERGFDRIIMNPPFDSGLDIKHIRHAESMLAPGGRLVALCGNGPRQQEIFQDRADYWEPLPEGSFKSEGTGVNVAMLVLGAPPAGQKGKQFPDGLF